MFLTAILAMSGIVFVCVVAGAIFGFSKNDSQESAKMWRTTSQKLQGNYSRALNEKDEVERDLHRARVTIDDLKKLNESKGRVILDLETKLQHSENRHKNLVDDYKSLAERYSTRGTEIENLNRRITDLTDPQFKSLNVYNGPQAVVTATQNATKAQDAKKEAKPQWTPTVPAEPFKVEEWVYWKTKAGTKSVRPSPIVKIRKSAKTTGVEALLVYASKSGIKQFWCDASRCEKTTAPDVFKGWNSEHVVDCCRTNPKHATQGQKSVFAGMLQSLSNSWTPRTPNLENLEVGNWVHWKASDGTKSNRPSPILQYRKDKAEVLLTYLDQGVLKQFWCSVNRCEKINTPVIFNAWSKTHVVDCCRKNAKHATSDEKATFIRTLSKMGPQDAKPQSQFASIDMGVSLKKS